MDKKKPKPPSRRSKWERENEFYKKMGIEHPMDTALRYALKHLQGFIRKSQPPERQDR